MFIGSEDYPIENPKYYLVVLEDDGSDIKELLFTRKAIQNYLDETEAEETTGGICEDSEDV